MSEYLVVLDSEYVGSLEIHTGVYDEETGYPEFQDIDPTDLVIGVFKGTEDDAILQAAKYWEVDPGWLKAYRIASSSAPRPLPEAYREMVKAADPTLSQEDVERVVNWLIEHPYLNEVISDHINEGIRQLRVQAV